MLKEKKPSLSILIPTYNNRCLELVRDLQEQAEEAGIDYEIVVADDGSSDQDAIAANRDINSLPGCRLDEQPENMGRARIRNHLARQARHEYLLFIDSDMKVKSSHFLRRYLECCPAPVADGGIVVGGDPHLLRNNLRYRYEKAAEKRFTAERRQQAPHHNLHTANLLVRRDIMAAHPFDSRFRHYGYEDVLFGKHLQKSDIPVVHIDNPLGFETFETNAEFVGKCEEALRTLYEFRDSLRGFSSMLSTAESRTVRMVTPLIRLWHAAWGKRERSSLCGNHPSLLVLKIYKLGYYLSIHPSKN